MLATTSISEDGTLTATVEVPPDLALGAHRIYATAPATVASAPVTITVVGSGSGASGELAASGGGTSPWPIAAGLFALCTGAALAWAGRRRPIV